MPAAWMCGLARKLAPCARVYNIAVIAPVPQKVDEQHRRRHPVYAAEATGLLLMAVLLLVLILIRYWPYIHWSVR
jgi:hypothetical protein